MSSNVDLEAQNTVSGTHQYLPSQLQPLAVHDSRPIASDPIDDFFGSSSSSSGTRESRHDRRISQSDVLPPYFEAPPAYTAKGSNEPLTLAMYLFKLGFLFPPFWIMGAFVLLLPPAIPADSPAAWLPEKTESERQEILEKIRRTEMKWARRCLVALVALVLIALSIGLSAWAVLRS